MGCEASHAQPRRSLLISIQNRIVLHLVLVGLAFGGMAGCLTADTDQEEAKTLVSRVHTLTVTKDSMERANDADNPEDALKEILRSDLVVRVDAVGDYSLEYTTRLGVVKTERLLTVAPGLPATVTDVDPFAAAKLRKGTEVVFERKANDQDWWHVGDVPLGVLATPGAAAAYASKATVTESVALSDVDVPQGDIHLDSLKFTLNLPLEGTLEYEMGAAGPDGAPVEVDASYFVPSGQGDLVTAEVKATQDGAAGTAGVKAGLEEAVAKGGIRFWIKDGQPVAGQFTGGSVDVDPKVVMWAEGFFADMAEGQSCAGKTKADNCQPEEIEPYSESLDASDKEEFPVDEYPTAAQDEDVQKAVDTLKRLFAMDIVQGDKVQLIATFSDEDVPGAPSGFNGESRTDFVLEAVGEEKVTVRAGTFDAMKLVQSFHSRTTTSPLSQDGKVLVKALNLNETLVRQTFWLDARTYQPVKMTSEMPVDIDRLFKNVLAAVGDDAWDQAGMEPIRDDQWKVTADAQATYEATRIDPTTRFAAVTGLFAAQALASTGMAIPMSALGMAGMPFGGPMYGDVAEPAYPMRSLAVTSAGPLANGVKAYTVSSASPGFYWGDLTVTLDGSTIFQDTEACADPVGPFWVACSDGTVEESYDTIDSGDGFRIAARSGQTLRFIDANTNSVVMSLMVA